VPRQASAQAYVDVIWLMGIVTLRALTPALLMRQPELGSGAAAAH